MKITLVLSALGLTLGQFASKTKTTPDLSQYHTAILKGDSSVPIITEALTSSQTQMRYLKRSSNNKKGESNVFTDVLIGFFLFVFSVPALFFGERRSVRQKEQVEKAFKITKSINKTEPVKTVGKNELIFVSGKTKVDDLLHDEYVTVEFKNVVKLQRIVEVLQMVERQKKSNDNDAEWYYEYEKEWRKGRARTSESSF